MDKVLAVLAPILTNELFIAAALGIILHFYRQFRGDKAGKEIAAFDLAVKLGYDGVRNLSALYPSKGLDKATRGLEIFSKALATELGRPPTEDEKESAKLHFDAIHANEAELKARGAPASYGVAGGPAPVPPTPLGAP